MDYALLDWDNTLRQGYTLFSWIDYLIEVGTVGSVVREEIDYYIEESDRNSVRLPLQNLLSGKCHDKEQHPAHPQWFRCTVRNSR